MRHRSSRTAQRVFISIAVPIVSLCATFILLYVFVPRQEPSADVISEQTNQTTKDTPKTTSEPAQVAVPVTLLMPSIGVTTVIKPVGLTPEGDMAIDDNPNETAWYQLGPKPGEKGSAVIAGHYGWKNGAPSIFNDVSKLVKGDQISVIGDDDQRVTFTVTHSAVYDPEQDATDVFKSRDGKAHLNLITCQGSWNNAQQTYSERLVVFSELAK